GDRVWLFQAVVPYLWSTAHIEMRVSNDRGQTWSSPAVVSHQIGSNTRYPPVQTMDGGYLLPAYDDLFQRLLFFYSPDGQQWNLQSHVSCIPPYNCIQASVVCLADGRLLAVMRNTGRGWLWVMASDDDGKSWSLPKDSHFPNPDSPAVLLQLNSGNLILVYNDSVTDRQRLSVAISGDEGLTWPHHRIIADGSSSYSYPAAVQTPDGLIHVLYSLGRHTIQHIVLNEAWIASSG
ncbi:MAG: exo-alpha-sialidase, partial [Planctomycetota bacterium]